jgi:L-ectoine synthase
MIVRQLDELSGSPQEVVTPNWTSRRLLLKRDGMGFSMHETIIQPGTRTHIWYKHHLEAVLCIEGEGEVEVLPEARIYPIAPGVLYALDRHDRHYLCARTRMRLVCVFNPPLTGREVHDEEGVYPLVEEQPAG